jgi:hypothetical protein
MRRRRREIQNSRTRYDKPLILPFFTGYWYGIKGVDPDRIKEYNITKYAFLMVDKGIAILPADRILEEIRKNNFDITISEGKIRHYHMRIFVEGDRVFWKLRDRNIDISNMFIKT